MQRQQGLLVLLWPFYRSTALRCRYILFSRSEVRGIRACSRLAPIQWLAPEHGPVGSAIWPPAAWHPTR